MRPQREKGAPCEACGRPVEVGQVVLGYDDVGEVHVDCEHPWSLDLSKFERDDNTPEPSVLLGEPMLRYPIPERA